MAACRRLSADGGGCSLCHPVVRVPRVARPCGALRSLPCLCRGLCFAAYGLLLFGCPLHGDLTLSGHRRQHAELRPLCRDRSAPCPLRGVARLRAAARRRAALRPALPTPRTRSGHPYSRIPGSTRSFLIFGPRVSLRVCGPLLRNRLRGISLLSYFDPHSGSAALAGLRKKAGSGCGYAGNALRRPLSSPPEIKNHETNRYIHFSASLYGVRRFAASCTEPARCSA